MVSDKVLKHYLWTGHSDYGMISGTYLAEDEETLKAELQKGYQVKVKRAIVLGEMLTPNVIRMEILEQCTPGSKTLKF